MTCSLDAVTPVLTTAADVFEAVVGGAAETRGFAATYATSIIRKL